MNILERLMLYLRGISIMNKNQYLKRLEELLSDIDKIDRDEAIDYYRSYFDEAGYDNESQIIETLGSPEKLSLIIRDSLNNDFEQNIEIGDEGITNNKYKDKNEIQEVKNKEKMNKKDKMIFLILILCLCVPISSLLNALFGMAGVITSIVLFFFGFWIITFVLYVIGALCIAFGVLNIFQYLGAGLIFVGIGLILIAFGNVVGMAAKWFFKSFIPKVINTSKDWISSILARRIPS